MVLAVHVIPSADVAALSEPCAVTKNTPPPKLMLIQLEEDGSVLAVHVVPLVDEAATVDPEAS